MEALRKQIRNMDDDTVDVATGKIRHELSIAEAGADTTYDVR